MTRTRRALTGAVVPLMMAGAVQVVGPAPAHAARASAPVTLELLPGMTGGEATAVNAAGVIVGYENAGDAMVPVTWVDRHVTALAVPAGYEGTATDVNNAGLIVGNIHRRGDNIGEAPVSWGPDGQMAWLAPGFTGWTRASRVNDFGDIVGTALPDGGNSMAVRYAGGQVVPIVNDPSVRVAQVLVANLPADNVIAGELLDADERWWYIGFAAPADGGPYTVLPGPLPHQVDALSGNGTTIAGTVTVADNLRRHTALWRRTVDPATGRSSWRLQDLGTVLGPAYLQPLGISPDATTLAGVIYDGSTPYAAAWRNGSYYLLRTGFARDVNDAGLIVGSDAQYRPVTWTLTGP
jgi:uncharacterized membrane protein